jgi:hypothetical protein
MGQLGLYPRPVVDLAYENGACTFFPSLYVTKLYSHGFARTQYKTQNTDEILQS